MNNFICEKIRIFVFSILKLLFLIYSLSNIFYLLNFLFNSVQYKNPPHVMSFFGPGRPCQVSKMQPDQDSSGQVARKHFAKK